MKPAVLRLIVPAALFAAWLGYLGWLVANRPLQAEGYPLVVSRPQVLVSEADVVAELPARREGGEAVRVKVAEVLFDRTGTLKAGQEVEVRLLEACRPVPPPIKNPPEPPDDWDGPGTYLVPLRRTGSGWEVCPIPPSPGFQAWEPRRLYKATAETRAQYGRIKKP
ncbi:MAG: hypothetical protein K2W96_26330 [Gemmataceae bacterium]|nr:hypothetical protein [Gemmataceae bacterium]